MIAALGAEIVSAGGRPSALDIGADSSVAGHPHPALISDRFSAAASKVQGSDKHAHCCASRARPRSALLVVLDLAD